MSEEQLSTLALEQEGDPEDNHVSSESDDVQDGPIETDRTERIGTTSSARFNILSTMVGGGSLSLPMAFQKCGNGFAAPIFLVLIAITTKFCFRILVTTARTISPVNETARTPGFDSFESVAAAAFGPYALIFSKGLVIAMCFFGTVGYAVLLRDMLQPIADEIFPNTNSWHYRNALMFAVVLIVTPLCTLQNLTSLKRFGAASMTSILILGLCILYRAIQCNLGLTDKGDASWWTSFHAFPEHPKNLLDAFPLFVSCYVCHYNILPVHNELRCPSDKRVEWWLSSTVWSSTIFYMVLGLAGSAYSHCIPDGHVHGNILLDFDESDPLVLVGRMCLALTITLAFPMLTIPARDIVLRSMPDYREGEDVEEQETTQDSLQEPLLAPRRHESSGPTSDPVESTFLGRLVIATIFFWSGAIVASCVESIDIVWALLGSSLSIVLSYLIPCGVYVSLVRGTDRWWAWALLLGSVPLMIISTANAVYNTFY